MKNQFVTYEIAKRLKELGFNEPCFGYFTHSGKYISKENIQNDFFEDSQCAAPLWQQAIDWLRNKHTIDIWVRNTKDEEFVWNVDVRPTHPLRSGFEKNYYQAREAAILKALTLIP